ncbi:E3 ubiquitin ligase family protein [Chryseobacterium sp. X308]|uniref:E3 ubiquitin ligase family protein n=1 Tax=Chryseobacterium sp. X308 TaxID=2884873 RepID=UPI001D14C147|nr:E3 ubiquitin ligase family protein [Chryseobacterium sp. X308]MCC3216444.1 E3 ubiquitin ligase family protein [Chryseobacterium sp. X308]
MEVKKGKPYIGYSILGIIAAGFIYFILWIIFKDRMPLHEYASEISNNYDSYAEKAIVFFPLLFFVFIFIVLMKPTASKRFLRLQSSLPTSKIHSVAKGLAEIEGTLMMMNPLFSPVNDEACIGYYYTIEDIDRDSDGKESYRTIHRETKCNTFRVKDDTGTIEVEPKGIELVLLEETNISSHGGKRYKETLLKDGQKMLLVGYADSRNGTPFIRKDEHYKILGITSSSGITVWNKYQPLLRSFMFTCSIILLIIIYILIQ